MHYGASVSEVADCTATTTAKRGVEYGVHRSPDPVYRSFLTLHGLHTGV